MSDSSSPIVRALALACLLLVLVVATAGAQTMIQTVTTPAAVVESRILDLDGDGRTDLMTVQRNGRVTVWHSDAKTGRFADEPAAALLLPHADRTLLATADVLGIGSMQLVAASPDGVVAYPIGADGGFAAEPVRLLRRTKFGLRIGAPRFSDIVQDLNRDGRPDLVIPFLGHPRERRDVCEVWLNLGPTPGAKDEGDGDGDGEAGAKTRWKRTTGIPFSANRLESTDGEALSDVYEAGFTIPALALRDVNGDGREDLLVEDGEVRAFHLQKEDGTIPPTADFSFDLDRYRDTTREAQLRPGRTWAGSDRKQFIVRDLDGDGIADYAIAHRRKVWIIRGAKTGPDLSAPVPVKLLDDVSFLTFLRLDEDEFADLLVVKVEVPSVIGLISGLLGDWEVDIRALGYVSRAGRDFDRKPKWTSTLSVRLPSIRSMMRNPEKILSMFEAVGDKIRAGVEGDFDGDGKEDIVLQAGDGRAVELWHGHQAIGTDDRSGEDLVRRLLFETDDNTWTLERIASFLGSLVERHFERYTGGRTADAKIATREAAGLRMDRLETGDIDGDGKAELFVLYRDEGEGLVVDVVRW